MVPLIFWFLATGGLCIGGYALADAGHTHFAVSITIIAMAFIVRIYDIIEDRT